MTPELMNKYGVADYASHTSSFLELYSNSINDPIVGAMEAATWNYGVRRLKYVDYEVTIGPNHTCTVTLLIFKTPEDKERYLSDKI